MSLIKASLRDETQRFKIVQQRNANRQRVLLLFVNHVFHKIDSDRTFHKRAIIACAHYTVTF